MKQHRCDCCVCAGTGTGISAAGSSRREFLVNLGAITVGGLALTPYGSEAADLAPLSVRHPSPKVPLKVQPVFTYDLPKRREATSWRSWGGVQTEEDAAKEKTRIAEELSKMARGADFPLEILPLTAIRNVEQASAAARGSHDALLIYAAGGGGNLLESLTLPDRWNLMFLRHDPGPVYLWYEIVHPRFLRKTVDGYGQPGMGVEDVVVDSYDELLWRLRALCGLKNTLGRKIVAIGGAGGWGAGGATAPQRCRELWKMDIVDYPYKELGSRIERARQDGVLVGKCRERARRYLRQRGVSLLTTREFVDNAFVLREVLNDIMDEAKTDAITVHHCMGTIMPISQTTACLPLSLMNDDGYLAFCESDFVVIPSGILLHCISGKPVFLNDPTYPHGNVVTLAHCTAPRKMDGKRFERAKIMTHFESDYGAAPKVEMRIGQVCTNIVPDFASRKWVGFEGTIVGNPFLDICRSQIDVRINGDCASLLEEMKGFHWMMSYGSYLRETGYALKKVGVGWMNV